MLDINLLKKLCLANGASGDENKISNIIKAEIEPFVEEITIDAMGNLIVFKKGLMRAKSKLMVSAHMDEVGLMVTHITDEGFLKFASVGGISAEILPGSEVLVGENNINGVIGLAPIHLQKKNKAKIDIDSLYIDIGANGKKDAEKYVSPGDYIYFKTKFTTHDETIACKAIDDRSGCAILIDLIKSDIKYDCYFAFLVQEEVGTRGARTAAYKINPDCAIVVDITTACDIPKVPSEKQITKLAYGAALPIIDHSMIYDKDFINLAKKIAKQNNIKIQFKEAKTGGTDAGAICVSRDGVKTFAIVGCARYLHSATSIVNINDLENVSKLLRLTQEEICSKKWGC